MKKILSTIILLLATASVFADSSSDATASSTASATTSSTASATTSSTASPITDAKSAGNVTVLKLDQSAHNSGNVAGTDLSNAVPNVSAPNLATTLTETCMGSTSAGAAGAGFGFSFGTTWRDSACVRRLDARQITAFGDIATAREMMCDSELVRAAAKRAGKPCVEDGGVPYGQVAIAPVVQEIATEAPAAAVVTQQVKE